MLPYVDVFTVHTMPEHGSLKEEGMFVCREIKGREGGREGGREEGRYILCMSMTLSRRKLFVRAPMRLLQLSPMYVLF
jgi:hypothetical protein